MSKKSNKVVLPISLIAKINKRHLDRGEFRLIWALIAQVKSYYDKDDRIRVTNNGEYLLTDTMCKKHGAPTGGQRKRCTRSLIKKGMIRVTQPGKGGRATLFGLTVLPGLLPVVAEGELKEVNRMGLQGGPAPQWAPSPDPQRAPFDANLGPTAGPISGQSFNLQSGSTDDDDLCPF